MLLKVKKDKDVNHKIKIMSKYNLIDIYEEYQIGSGWTRDFDYDGMLKAGLKTGVDTDLELLKKMVEDYTDVNYHREAHHLYNAIEALEQGAIKEASMFFGDFHAEIENTMKEQGMDIEPTVGQFMASKMEEEKELEKKKGVKEMTGETYNRIDGLTDQRLLVKFLESFNEIYSNMVEGGDLFDVMDVIDYLSSQMQDYARDTSMDQGGMMEEDTIEEDKYDDLAADNDDIPSDKKKDIAKAYRMLDKGATFDDVKHLLDEGDIADELEAGAIGTHLDEGAVKELEMALLDVGTQAEVDQYMDSLKRSKDTFDNIDDYIEDFKNYVADKALQEHFGRFMKDYQ